jgi:SAM-dependent methyltransferase
MRASAPPAPRAADPLKIFTVIQGALNDRMRGRTGPETLPVLRFPDPPSGALAKALSHEYGQRDWTEMLEGLGVGRDGRMLDFGCGASDRRSLAGPLGLRWFGLDVPFSMESTARSDRSAVTFYGGSSVPFADAAFDLVISIQVFEHVPEPHTTFAEMARILRTGGYLVGSTSFNEPFHSESTFGYSPKNFARMIDEAGFDPIEITPGIDMWSLAMRRLARQFRHEEAAKVISPFFGTTASPLNQIIDECAARQNIEAERANALKLELSGQFNFLARKR